jgi:hypothetical protein
MALPFRSPLEYVGLHVWQHLSAERIGTGKVLVAAFDDLPRDIGGFGF